MIDNGIISFNHSYHSYHFSLSPSRIIHSLIGIYGYAGSCPKNDVMGTVGSHGYINKMEGSVREWGREKARYPP